MPEWGGAGRNLRGRRDLEERPDFKREGLI